MTKRVAIMSWLKSWLFKDIYESLKGIDETLQYYSDVSITDMFAITIANMEIRELQERVKALEAIQKLAEEE